MAVVGQEGKCGARPLHKFASEESPGPSSRRVPAIPGAGHAAPGRVAATKVITSNGLAPAHRPRRVPDGAPEF